MDNCEKSYNKICRLCLQYDKYGKMTPLVDSWRESKLSAYGEAVRKLLNLSIQYNDNLPKNICHQCKNKLKKIDIFRKQCKTNSERLTTLLECYKNESEESKKEAALRYSMFNQHFPDKNLLSSTPKANKKLRNETKTKGEKRVAKMETHIDYSSNYSDNEEPQQTENKSDPEMSNIDLMFAEMDRMFATEPRRKRKTISCPEDLTCKVCNRKLANKSTYLCHIQKHDKYLFICDQCGKGFPSKSNMNIHQVAKHGTPSSYECDTCGFKAPRRLELVEHIRLHTGERPFACEKCGLTFRRRAIYVNHKRTHEDKNVQCPLCDKKFNRKQCMTAHMNNIHERMYLYLCRICNTSYARSTTVRKHMASKHGIPKEMQGKITRVTKSTHKGFFKDGNNDMDVNNSLHMF